MTTSVLTTVVFDLGEVLASAPDLFETLARRVGRTASDVEVAYWRYREDYDRGGSEQHFWVSVLDDLSVLSTTPMVAELSSIDNDMWTSIRPEAESILADLAKGGVHVAVLSNAPSGIARLARAHPWSVHVSDWFFSAEMGVTKPAAEIYARVEHSLGVAGDALVFFDDRAANVEAAQRAGWDAYLWQSDEATRRTLSGLALL